jgi:death-on-curing protein
MLTVDDVVTVARSELGPATAVDGDRLAEAIAEPARTSGDRESYPGLVPKAAALLLALLRQRPFSTGNARIALLATIVFLNRNGYDVVADDDDELIALVAVASTGELTVLDAATALERFVVRLTP